MNAKVYKWCAVPQCTNTSIKSPNKLFMYVPHKKKIRYKWLKLARRDSTGILPSTQIYFCEDHFDLPNDMDNFMQYHLMGSVSRIRLKPECVPTKFYCQPNRRKLKSNTSNLAFIPKKQRKMSSEQCEENTEDRNIASTKQLELEEISFGDSEMSITTAASTFISPNICRCCHSFGFYTDISAEFNAPEGNETYEDILNKTFNIQISSINKGTAQSSKQICDECINKLQEAFAFRNMVVANERKMLEHFETDQCENLNPIKEFEHTNIKSEIFVKEECTHEEYLENETIEGNLYDEPPKASPQECGFQENEEIFVANYGFPIQRKRRKTDAERAKEYRTRKKAKVHIDIKEEPECDVEETAEPQVEITSNKLQDKLQNNEDDKWSTVLDTKRGLAPILRENSMKLLENSTMFPFQYNKCRYLCLMCKEQFIEMATLRNHHLTHSEENLKGIIKRNATMVKVEISVLDCAKCGETFENLDDFRDHLTEKHAMTFPINESLLIPFKIENEGLKCQICTESYDNFRNLSIHVNKHYKNHICDVCGLSFSNLVFLNLHKTRTHRRHACRECGLNFETGTDKKKHDIDKHNVVKEKKLRFVCSFCKERFSQENLKIQHLVDKHGLKRPDYKCPLCSKGFITKSLCNNHMKNVHLKEKKHECDVCNNFFYTKSDLMRHRVTHTGEKNFSCALCSTLFATKDSLRRHIKRSHN